MTPRKAAALASQLPAGAQTWISMDIPGAWTQESHLAADQFDATQIGNWQRGGGEGKKPPRIERPGDALRKKARADSIAAKAARFQARQKQQREGRS